MHEPTPLRGAFRRFVFWTLITTIALYFDEGPEVLLPAAMLLGAGWWFFVRREGR